MHVVRYWSSTLVVGSLLLFACSSTPDAGGGTPDTTVNDDLGGGEADASPPPVVVAPPLACDDEVACDDGLTCRSGVCLGDPVDGEVGVLTDATGLAPYPAEEPPNLSCVGEASAAPDGPPTATLYGAVTRFGSGLVTTEVQVEVFRAEDWDPSACEEVKGTEARVTCYREYGSAEHADTHGLTPVGSTLSVRVEDMAEEQECEGHGDCPLGYECLEGDLDDVCLEQFGLYSVAEVPTNTLLVIRAYATTNERKWHDVYTFGAYLYADQLDATGRYHYDVTMVSTGQWELTANIAGIGDIPEENGALGGRVRDCRVVGVCGSDAGVTGEACTLDSDCAAGESCDGGRASWPIGGATIGLAEPAAAVVYFNNLEDDTVPLDFRTTTNVLGRYAALDIPAGWNQVAGVVRLEDEVVSVGGASVYIVPGALSVVGWPGLQPHWKQE